MKPAPTILLVNLAFTSLAIAQNHIVVPASFAATDAFSYEWIAGASHEQRQQTLIAASHLTGLLNQQILALELRRTAVDEAYAAGSANLTVSLSIAPHAPAACRATFADNVGPSPVQVFSGIVALPASPAVPSGVGSPVAWTPNNVVRIAFAQPFLYTGGTLCVDILGQPIAGQKVWWMADASEEVIPGTGAVDLGPGCGGYGGVGRRWSHLDERSLVAGGTALFRAEGGSGGLAAALFGVEATAPMFPQYPLLSQWGIPTPNCLSYVNPLLVFGVVPAMFDPQSPGPLPNSAMAEVRVALPASPAWLDVTMTTQWFDFAQLASSNGIRWTTGASIPTLGMALCEGSPQLPLGHVTTYLAHVMRFEF